MSASFQISEPGLDHQAPMPVAPPPEGLRDQGAINAEFLDHVPEKVRSFFQRQGPFEFRPVSPPNYIKPVKSAPAKQVWFRLLDRLPDEQPLHRCLLAYVSDYHVLETATLPHGVSFMQLQMASIDHAIWFHRDVRVDEWLLYVTDSPSASGARGFGRGAIFTRDGTLVASVAQEGLMRQHSEWKSPAGQQK
jgi:acyl-CoA thioesterase-2